jgi:antitoxin component YwqK of YwqJK toxin-antitoxin module
MDKGFVNRRITFFHPHPAPNFFWPVAKVGICLSIFFFLLTGNLLAQTQWIKKTKYYDAGNLVVKEIFHVDPRNQNIRTGPFSSFFTNGLLKTRGNYLSNQPDGCWERFYETGVLRSVSFYKNGKLEGPGNTYFETGKLAQSGFYLQDQEDSTWTFFYESGPVKSTGTYRKGRPEGFWKYFHEDSTLKGTAYLVKGRGWYKELFGNGLVRMEGIIDQGASDSVWRYYHENGVLKAIGHEKKGERQGYWKFFYNNGNPSSEGHFKDNLKFGRWKYYHETGGVSSEGDLESDQKDGAWKFFFPSGALMGQATFVKGTGDYVEFYDNGKIKMKGRIENNKYEGPWKFYFEDGGLEGECFYVQGTGQYSGYYENGSVKMKGKMQNGQKIGSWDLLGRDGKLIGHYTTFYEMTQPAVPPKPALSTSDTTAKPRPRNTGKADFLFSKRANRHFTQKINEVKGFIVGGNPFALAISSLPFGIEYFFHDRLGYEVMVTIFRQPFFRDHSEATESKKVFTIGNSVDFRQKLYSPDRGTGSLYIGQELRLSNYTHKLLTIEGNDSISVLRNYVGEETKVELTLLLGNRLFGVYNKHNTLTLDLYAGIGFGFRFARIPEQLLIYNRLKTNRITIPVRIGFNFGYFF